MLNHIIDRSDLHQHELIELLRTIENKEQPIREDFALDIVTVIEKGMTDFTQKVPNVTQIIADWEAVSNELKLTANSKAKLKLTIPFLFFKFEKEFAWNGNDWFKAIKEDIKRGVKGDWSEMFVAK